MRSLNIIIGIAFTFISVSNVIAQSDSSLVKKPHGFFHRIKTDGINTGKTIIETYKRPFKWKKKDWGKFGGAIAISGLVAVTIDEPMSDLFLRNHTKTLDKVADVGDFLGQPEHNYPFMLAVWSSGVIANNDWLRDTGILLVTSVSTSGLIQTFLKEAVGRARPSADTDPFEFKPFSGEARYHSFPSGHTMLALASSWILARQINWLPAKIVFYGLPVLVGLSRVYDQAHWFSDILLGSALGVACAETVLKIYPKLKEKSNLSGLKVLPGMNSMRLVYTF